MSVVRIYDMKQKEVINVCDGSRLGYICDMEIDTKSGKIVSIIIPGPSRVFCLFGGNEKEYKIKWSDICQIGEDLILVDVDPKEVLVDC